MMPPITEALRTVAVAFIGIGLGFAWYAVRTTAIPAHAPDRLVSELRLAQFAALLLSMTAGAYIGFAVEHETELGVGFDIAIAVGFFVVAAATLVQDPRQALTVLAFAFATHAVVDIAHRQGILAPRIAPDWYVIGCAIYDVGIGLLCYLPILRRPSA